MKETIDKMILSTPLVIAVGLGYFVLLWKPRQIVSEKLVRTEAVFWSVTLSLIALIGVYAVLSRR